MTETFGQPGTDLVPYSTIEEVAGRRDKALELYAAAWKAVARANNKLKKAHAMAKTAFLGEVNGFTYTEADEVKRWHRIIEMVPESEWNRTARKLVDNSAWAGIIARTELETLMDVEETEKLHKQMRYIPDRVDPHTRELITGEEAAKGLPEFTAENVRATLEGFMANADMIARRGLANAFSKLDRRFKSHDGFKIGSRIIITNCFSDSGSWNWHSHPDRTIMDVERVLALLDGQDVKRRYASAVGSLDRDMIARTRRVQGCIEVGYFRLRMFLNGNLHIWFTRKDLLAKVNQILAEWYGEVIADGRNGEADPLADKKWLPAKRYGYFPTPSRLAEEVVGHANLSSWDREAGGHRRLRILEPSAGGGALARLCAAPRFHKHDNEWSEEHKTWIQVGKGEPYRHRVDCVELQPHLADELKAEGIYNRVWCQDFLTLSPAVTGLYDRIVMNPPFDLERDIDHVMHALDFLEPQGFLTAIMSAGTEFRETRKAVAFRALMKKLNAQTGDLPPGSFSEMGTNVNTMLLKVWKCGRSFYWR